MKLLFLLWEPKAFQTYAFQSCTCCWRGFVTGIHHYKFGEESKAMYTARQLSGITVASQIVEIYVKFNESNPEIIEYLLRSSDRVLWSTITFVQSQSTFFSGVLISPTAPKAVYRICVDHIQLWAVAVCELRSQNKFEIMPTNNRPLLVENIDWLWDCGLS